MVDGGQLGVPERREAPRTLVSVPLSLYGNGRRLLLTSRTVDLSPAGALLHGLTPVRIGERVQVEVPRGASRNPLRLLGEIVRITTPDARRRQHAVAVRFVEVSPIDAAILQGIIADATTPAALG